MSRFVEFYQGYKPKPAAPAGATRRRDRGDQRPPPAPAGAAGAASHRRRPPPPTGPAAAGPSEPPRRTMWMASIRARAAVAALALCGALAPGAGAGVVEVKLGLPVRARIDLRNRHTVAIAPFLVVTKKARRTPSGPQRRRPAGVRALPGQAAQARDRPQAGRSGPVDYPTYDLDLLAKNRDFWRGARRAPQADLILAGSLDFDIQDHSGYRTEEYISPFDGRAYYRQVLVEQTGFDYDIVMQVFDGKTGELLYTDNFKDFKKFEGERADPLPGMFENLLFARGPHRRRLHAGDVETTRILFTD